MSKATVRVTVGDKTKIFRNAPEGAVIKIEIERSLPERSPLHPKALNMADLQVGMKVQRHHRRGSFGRSGTIYTWPFRRYTKYHDSFPFLGNIWMVSVVTTNYKGELVHEDWYLSDMGVVPYEGDGRFRRWNDQNYTLAVG